MQKYYTDGVTEITDGFYICKCQNGHQYWSCTYEKKCSRCDAKLLGCIPANKKEETV
ncbi:MAG: hypothetical protein SOZ48_00890 [Eubacterium sp.]|nr:hypothetical protein [Eubacterium sp.]